MDVARRWWAEGDARTRWVVKHGLRTLVKRGNQEAIGLLGYSTAADVSLERLKLSHKRVTVGDGGIGFSFDLATSGSEAAEVVIDYCVHHCRANGSRSPKVFKLARKRLVPGERVRVEGRHRIVPLTTRRYYAGRHRLDILVNGRTLGGADFELLLR